MGKLKALRPMVPMLTPRLTVLRDDHGHSAQAEPWRRWYKEARWERTRTAAFVRDDYTCQMEGCGAVTARPIGDHKDPKAKESRARFFDVNEVQTLCKPCHDGRKQAQERRAAATGGGSKV